MRQCTITITEFTCVVLVTVSFLSRSRPFHQSHEREREGEREREKPNVKSGLSTGGESEGGRGSETRNHTRTKIPSNYRSCNSRTMSTHTMSYVCTPRESDYTKRVTFCSNGQRYLIHLGRI